MFTLIDDPLEPNRDVPWNSPTFWVKAPALSMMRAKYVIFHALYLPGNVSPLNMAYNVVVDG